MDIFANFESHIDKHGECKFILEYESGKFQNIIHNTLIFNKL